MSLKTWVAEEQLLAADLNGNFTEQDGLIDLRHKTLNITADVTNAPTDTSENTIYSFTLPGGSLGTTNAVRIRILGTLGNGGNGTLTLRLKIGSTTIASFNRTVNASMSSGGHIIDAIIVANGATNAQIGDLVSTWNTTSASLPMLINRGTAAENSTGNLTVAITAQWASTPGSADFYSGIAELLKV